MVLLLKERWKKQLNFNVKLCFQAKTKGCQSRVDIGVKYADKQERVFDEEKMRAGQCVIGLQVQLSPASACWHNIYSCFMSVAVCQVTLGL